MIAIGVGGADCGEAMAGLAWEVLDPKLIGVRLTGKLSGWTSAKDVITYLLGLLTVKGGTNKIVEYFGPGAASISATGKGTICNMGAELGATTSALPLRRPHGRLPPGHRPRRHRGARRGQSRAPGGRPRGAGGSRRSTTTRSWRSTSPSSSPTSSVPHSPDRARPISQARRRGEEGGLARPDQGRAHRLVHELLVRGHEARRARRDAGAQGGAQGQDAVPRHARAPSASTRPSSATASWRPSSRSAAPCSPTRAGRASGSGSAPTSARRRANTIVSSFNRNFPGRNDGSAATLSFLTSPEIVTALAFAGTLEFDPVHGTHDGARRQGVPLHAARVGGAARAGLRQGRGGLRGARRRRRRRSRSQIPPDSERLQLLQPFPRWDGADFVELPILVKTKGKTTTDHISPGGRLAPLPRPPRQDQRQHVPGRAQRVHGRDGQGREPA